MNVEQMLAALKPVWNKEECMGNQWNWLKWTVLKCETEEDAQRRLIYDMFYLPHPSTPNPYVCTVSNPKLLLSWSDTLISLMFHGDVWPNVWLTWPFPFQLRFFLCLPSLGYKFMSFNKMHSWVGLCFCEKQFYTCVILRDVLRRD